MTSSNRVQITSVLETTIGTTPDTPRMRKARITGESLKYTPTFVDSDEIRDDRMNAAPILVFKENSGSINVEMHYPFPESASSNFIASAMFRAWINTPTFYNDGTADSVITDAGTTTDTYVVASGGASVVAGHLVRATGFTNSANNQIFRCASSTSSTIVGDTLSLTAETAPAATARLKVIGFEGEAGYISATSTGLASATGGPDFTTFGLAVGMFIKIGGTGSGYRFATEALNTWVRITAITAGAITCDNLPSTWTTDDGSGKTIRVFMSDWVYNGTTQISTTIERGFLGQTVPTYIVQKGMMVNQMQASVQSKQKITGSFDFIGMSGGQSTTALDASPDAAPSDVTYPVMAANVNVGRINEYGTAVTSPNYVKELNFTLNNNLTGIESADTDSYVAHREGEATVTGTVNTYFGSNALLARFYAGTATSLNFPVKKNNQALYFQFPYITYNGGGDPSAAGKNQDVMANFQWKASKDELIGCHIALQRFEYYQE